MGLSKRSYLTVENKTTTAFTTHVSDVWDHDWDGPGRPSNNYQGVNIGPNKSATNRAELSRNRGTGRLTMTLNFADGSVDKFTFDQKFAIGKCNPYFVHHIRNHEISYSRSGSETLVITVRNTQMQINNEKAKQKGKEAEQKTAAKLYAEALKAYDEASSLANDATLKKSLQAGKSGVYTTMANNSLNEALNLEQKSNKSVEATDAFKSARENFENAKKLSSNQQIDNKLKIIDAKLKGNELFNQALALDDQAVEMVENNMAYTDIKKKFEEALTKYTEAKTAFEVGAKCDKKSFDNSLEIVQKTIDNINKSLEKLAKNNLMSKLNDVSIKENVDENVNQNEENIVQQIDGAN